MHASRECISHDYQPGNGILSLQTWQTWQTSLGTKVGHITRFWSHITHVIWDLAHFQNAIWDQGELSDFWSHIAHPWVQYRTYSNTSPRFARYGTILRVPLTEWPIFLSLLIGTIYTGRVKPIWLRSTEPTSAMTSSSSMETISITVRHICLRSNSSHDLGKTKIDGFDKLWYSRARRMAQLQTTARRSAKRRASYLCYINY